MGQDVLLKVFILVLCAVSPCIYVINCHLNQGLKLKMYQGYSFITSPDLIKSLPMQKKSVVCLLSSLSSFPLIHCGN